MLYASTRPGRASLFTELAPTAAAVEAETGWVATLTQAPVAARKDALVDRLQPLVGRVLGFPEGRRLALDQGFFDAGMDSLMATDLRNRLQKRLGRPVSPTESPLLPHV